MRCLTCRAGIVEGDEVLRQSQGFVHLRCLRGLAGDKELNAAMLEPCELVCVAGADFPWEVRCERTNPRFPNLLVEAFYSIGGANAFATQNGVNIVRVRTEDEVPEVSPFCKRSWCRAPAFKKELCEKHYRRQFEASPHRKRRKPKRRKGNGKGGSRSRAPREARTERNP